MQTTEEILNDSIPFLDKLRDILAYQIENNSVYRTFFSAFETGDIKSLKPEEIPLLPIRGFKESRLLCESRNEKLIFKSSATGKQGRSRHFIPDPDLYRQSIFTEFYQHFPKDQYAILAYTPGYSENPDSSLIWMLNELITNDETRLSRFLPLGEPLKPVTFDAIQNSGKKVLLFGAAFGLLDLIELDSCHLPDSSCIIETGGMKTNRREMSKSELRTAFADRFGIPLSQIHSEYGMCEMQSQCYALGSEWFLAPKWVKVMIKKPDNPLENCPFGQEGKIGLIDLANVYTCPFILTEDRGVMKENGSFRVLGRWRSEDLRGCNFLIDRD
jgi:hypothetical protein